MNKRFKIQRLIPKEGNMWNPLLNFPRNNKCFCNSGKKAKQCCLPLIGRTISTDLIEFFKTNWDKLISGKMFIARREEITKGDASQQGLNQAVETLNQGTTQTPLVEPPIKTGTSENLPTNK